jgi:hypothetical protein
MGSHAFDPAALIAKELHLTVRAVSAVIGLLDEGGTVPFIARYRKEASGGLDEVQIRSIRERRDYPGELDERRRVLTMTLQTAGWTGRPTQRLAAISRELARRGQDPLRLVGTHRRVRVALEYKQRDDAHRKTVLDELTLEAEKHGLGY